jgi:hypothetical protein
MRTYRLQESGVLHAFEVSNTWLQPRAIARLMRSQGAEVTFQRRLFRSGDVHLQFKFQGKDFQVVEPFGDNSRYWIGPAEESPTPLAEVSDLHEVFAHYRPGFLGIIRSLSYGASAACRSGSVNSNVIGKPVCTTF